MLTLRLMLPAGALCNVVGRCLISDISTLGFLNKFLNNTANIEEYLNNLGKDDIPSIVNMLDRNEHAIETNKSNYFKGKIPSPKKKDMKSKSKIMKIDVLDSDVDIVKEILLKEDKTKPVKEKTLHGCFACKNKFENVQKLLEHMSVCDFASRTCMQCNMLFDSKIKMQEHSVIHRPSLPLSCNCGENFSTKEQLIQHHKVCHFDYGATVGCTYSCKKCGDIFKERFALYKHAKKHILKGDERVCDICGHTLIGNDALVAHKEIQHKKPIDVTYRCKVCLQIFTDRKEIYLHVQKHIAKTATRHLCESCGRSFATLSTLVRHSSQHNSKNFKCHVCGKLFTEAKSREEHVLMEHITVCEKCGQAVSRTKLQVHSCI